MQIDQEASHHVKTTNIDYIIVIMISQSNHTLAILASQ
jgi:hypothetical protein